LTRLNALRLLLFIVGSGLLFYPEAAPQEFNVVDITVEGNQRASTDLILSVAGIDKGDEITATLAQDAVRRLYGLGFFADVRIDAEEVTGGLRLIIIVKELPKLEDLRFEGNKKIKTNDLKERLNLNQGNYISTSLIYEKRNQIIDLYGEKGYFMVDIDYELKYSPDSSQADLLFKIKEGSKVKVEKVILTGSKQVSASKIVGQMRNRKRGLFKTSNFDKEKYTEDKDKIINYLHKLGYIDAYLKSDSITVDTAANRMTIYLDIYEGPRYYYGETSWSGNEVFADKTLNGVLKYKEGDVFNFEKFDESLYEIYFLYQEKGYLHIRVVDDRKTRDSLIDITFDIVEGLPSEINLVRITGNTKTKENVIRREMAIRPGQVFHRSLLLRSIRDIMQLNYFGNVTPDIVDLPSGDIDLVIAVEEKPTAQISAGAGYSGRDKFVGTFGLGIPNFRGQGQYLSTNVDIGSRRNSYTLSFNEPWAFSTPTLIGADLYYTNREWYTDYTEGREGASIQVGRRLRWPDNYCRAYLRYRLEGGRYYDFSDEYTLYNSYRSFVRVKDVLTDSVTTYQILGDPLPGSLEAFHEDWYTASALELMLIRDSRDLPEFATRGSIISYTVSESGGHLGGFWDYRKHEISLAKFIPLIGGMALAGKVMYGAVSSPIGDSAILEYERFAVGGTNYSGTVRGYDDGSLTPDTIITRVDTSYWFSSTNLLMADSVTDTTYNYVPSLRGKYMLVGNLELQIPLIKNQLYGLLFFDIGNSWLNRSDIKLNDLYKGVGLGFRLVVPGIGTLGFDFGYPLDDRRGQKRGWKPHFQIGTTIR
jgi:outer membrane protein insertion porin family